MFLLVILFPLVCLVDPLPTRKAESQLAPAAHPEKLAVIPSSAQLVSERSNNDSEAVHLFYKRHISRESSSLPENHAHKNVSMVTTAIIMPLSSSNNMEKRNSDAISESIENGSSFEDANINDNKKIDSPKLQEHYALEPLSPLVLKLDRKYTPSEIAEYIFTTGDEKGFAQGVAEMLEDGQLLTSRDDVLVFLEAVQKALANLRRQSRQQEQANNNKKGLPQMGMSST